MEPAKTKAWDNMHKVFDFIEYAEELGDSIVSKANNPQYLTFVNSLVQHICKPSIFFNIILNLIDALKFFGN